MQKTIPAPENNTETFIDLSYSSKNSFDVFEILDTTNSSLCEYYNGNYKKTYLSIQVVQCECGKNSRLFYGSQSQPPRCRFQDKGNLYGELLNPSIILFCSII